MCGVRERARSHCMQSYLTFLSEVIFKAWTCDLLINNVSKSPIERIINCFNVRPSTRKITPVWTLSVADAMGGEFSFINANPIEARPCPSPMGLQFAPWQQFYQLLQDSPSTSYGYSTPNMIRRNWSSSSLLCDNYCDFHANKLIR